MSVWDLYNRRINVNGSNMREAVLRREQHFLSTHSGDSLSYFTAEVEGAMRDVMIVGTDNLNTKFIYSMPGEDLNAGDLVCWMDNHWLITEKDAATEVYTKAKMIQCNYLLRWIDSDGIIREQWCIIEDGTKYLTGDYEDRDFIVTRGDTRIRMTVARNEHTVRFNRNCRFLIDDEESEHMLAYSLTKPYKMGTVYNGKGVFIFVLQEVNTTDDDNQELRIADYYKYHPNEKPGPTIEEAVINTEKVTETGKKVWI